MKTSGYLIISVLLINVQASDRRISDKRLCGDPTCSHPVSLARTLLRYVSDDARLLSFGKNVEVTIYSKSAGSKPDLWGAEIKGKRGYVPKGFVREFKILKSPLTYIVDTEEKQIEELEKNEDLENLTNISPTVSDNIDINKNVISSAEVSQIKSDEGSGKTPSLEDVSLRQSVYGDAGFSSFPGSGVSAEPLESETVPNPEDITQPYEVVDGTTISYDTDGSHLEAHQAVTTPSPELNVKHDASAAPSPEGDTLISSEEASNKNNDDDEVIEESSGHIYQYISSWISEGSGNVEDKESSNEEMKKEKVEEKKEEEEAEEDDDDEEEDDDSVDDEEDEEEVEEKVNEESEHVIIPEKKEILTSTQENEEIIAEEGKITANKEESQLTLEINKEKDYEGDKLESENTGDLVRTGADKDTNIEGAKDMEISEEPKESSIVTDKEEPQLEEEIHEEKNNAEVTENPSSEEITESVNTVVIPDNDLKVDDISDDSTESNIDKEDFNEEIPLGGNVSPLEDEEKLKITETPKIVHKEEGNANDNVTSQMNEAEEIDNIVEIDDSNDKPESELQNLFFNVDSSNDNLDKKSINDNQSEFLQLEEINTVSGSLPVSENESNYEALSKESDVEIVTSSSESGEAASSVEDSTEPSIIEEITVPVYEPPVEMTTVEPTDVSSESSIGGSKEDGILVEQISAESSGNYFPWVTNIFASLFGSSSSNVNIPEDANESEVEVTSEDIFQADDSEKVIRKREADLSSYWETSRENDASETTTPATCKVAYGSSAGIDSDCNDVSGEEPNYKESTHVKESEGDAIAMDLQKSFDTVICLIITGVTVIIFSLGYFYLEKKRRDGSLVAKINELEKALLVSSKECLILKDDLQATKEKLSSVEMSSVDSSETATSLNLEVEKCQVENSELKEQVTFLEKELENATEAGLELNRMLSDILSTQNSSETMMKSVEHLQKQLDSQQNTITSLTKSLNAKTLENENLQSDLSLALEKINYLEDDVQKVNDHLTSVLSEKLKMEEEMNEKRKSLDVQLNEVSVKKNAEISELHKEINNLQEMINEQKDNLVTKDNEVLVLQDCLKHLKSVDDGVDDDKLHALLDVGHIKAELKILTIERDTLAEKLQGEEDARKLLEDHMKIVNEELNRLRENYEEADKEKTEAQTRLEVLSNYFKEKETQLQKELGLQEAICLQKEGDATSTYEQVKCLQDEIENYRSQNDTLKKEILDQERSFKGQIASLEKKAHENWVAARQTERKLEESKQEASQLRNRLTIVEKNVTNNSVNCEPTKINDRLPGDSNGELPTSPVHLGMSLEDSSSPPQLFQHHDGLPTILPGPMMPPNPFVGLPPPGVFMPPPPPPPSSQSPGAPYMPPPLPLFPDRRPPPLGRMSSPPPHHYSPPPPDPRGTYSPYDDCSPPPSPLPIRYRSPPPHGNESSDRFRQHRSPPPPSHFKPYSSPAWDDSHGPARSGFRPLPPPEHRNSPREPKGPALSSGHSSDSLEKSSRHSGRV